MQPDCKLFHLVWNLEASNCVRRRVWLAGSKRSLKNVTNEIGTKGLLHVNTCSERMETAPSVREYVVATEYCEQRSLILILCHKKTASGVYSQGTQLRNKL